MQIHLMCPVCPWEHLEGGLGGQTFKTLESCQTAGPIGTKFGKRLRIHMGMDIG